MKPEIFKSVRAQNKDQDVPEFGNYSPGELRPPEVRKQRRDLAESEAGQGLYRSAVSRAIFFAYGIGEVPHVHFPNAEHFQHQPFAKNHWLRYGNMESENSRIKFMIEKYQRRRFPEEFSYVCRRALSNESALDEWGNQIPRVHNVSARIYEKIGAQMNENKIGDDFGYHNGDQGAYKSEPLFYESPAEMVALELQLWDRSLSQIAQELRNNDIKNVPSFLHLYNHIKDPITPLREILPNQARIFSELYEACSLALISNGRSLDQEKILVAQLALESSFLALPGVKNIVQVVYGGHQELPYIFVDVTRLPRGEFADPEKIFDVLFGKNDGKKNLVGIFQDLKEIGFGRAKITPITVSYFQTPYQNRAEIFIVDGNNRATAVLLMQFLNFVGFDEKKVINFSDGLRRFVSLHNLDIEWERDLAVLLRTLSPDQRNRLVTEERAIARQFENAAIPALLVQEPNFHTVDVAQSEAKRPDIFLLQPMHQAIYNDKRWSIAIPAKKQSHGRALGNDLRFSLD